MSSYKELDGVNQSSLKKIITHPQQYLSALKKYSEEEGFEKDHFVFGRAVDIMLVGNKEEFDDQFVRIPDTTKCSDTLKPIIDEIFLTASLLAEAEETTISLLEYYKTHILYKARAFNYYPNYKDDTVVATVIKQGSEYFELLKTTVGKTPITETEYAKAVNCMMALKANDFTKKYTRKEKGIEFWDRFIIQFEHKETKIKGELDRVVIDHNTKEITPIDFKTTSKSIYGFNSEFWKHRYDFQAATYYRGLMFHPAVKALIENGYKLNSFKYVVVEKQLVHQPMVFNVGPDVLFIGLCGGERPAYKIEGFYDAMNRYQWHKENDKWDYPMEYYEKGEINIKL
jgi:hypothetical protein